MNSTILLVSLLRLLVADLCAAGAFMLADQGEPGWGWFLFVALLLGWITVRSKSDGSAKVSE